MKNILSIVFVLLHLSATAQFFFERYEGVPVSEENGPVRNAWAGGINHAQCNNLDLNMDGRNDLVVFDKAGDKLICYLNTENDGLVLAPHYRAMFTNQHNQYKERLSDFVLMRDFNKDGKNDIFAYANGGMAVYRNDGNSDTLIFTLISPLLSSDYGNGNINIFVSPTDLPAIMDVDGDGDLDIVTFSLFGTSAEYHQNMSTELYGHQDSMVFELADPCWGEFAEDPSTVAVDLNVSCKGGTGMETPATGEGARHSGFTMVGLDIENDGDQDLILGIVSFDNMNLLTNSGNAQSAQMGTQDVNFPENNGADSPIDIYTFPAAFLADVDNDGDQDLIASAYQEQNGNDHQGTFLYENTATDGSFNFEFVQNDFLQDNMIDVGTGAYPVFFDVDGDGLQDLLIGNRGYFITTGTYSAQLAYYRNTGTSTEPAFTLQNRDYLSLSANGFGNIAPTFGDVDGDGDSDMIIGSADGLIHLYENTAGAGNPTNFVLAEPGFQGIDIIGQFATPMLFDVNGDGLLDLVIGERNGNLNYYRNTGTASNPSFILESENFGGVNMRSEGLSFGYSSPFLFQTDNGMQMLVGSESGRIDLYNTIEEIVNGPDELTATVGSGMSFSTGKETTPYGFSSSSGRNQYLFRAEELTDAGLQQGQVTGLSLFTENGPSVPHAQFYIKMGLTELDELNGFVDGNTTTYFVSDGTVQQGEIDYTMQTPIAWDGTSNLIVEFCWFQTAGNGTDLNVEFSTTDFNSNAFGYSGNFNGCGVGYTNSNNERPNITFRLNPAFNKVGEFPVYEGERSTIFGSDMDADGYMDFALGNLAGGLAYYRGAENGQTINSIDRPENTQRSGLHLYPNPNRGSFTVEPFTAMNGPVQLRVFNMLGEMVWSGNTKNMIRHTLDLSGLPEGMYVLDIRSEKKVAYERFVIQR